MHTRLKIALKQLGIKQEDLSLKLDLPISQIRHLSAGNKKITPEIAELIEKHTGINAVWLLLNRGEMFGNKDDNLLSQSALNKSNIKTHYNIPYLREIELYENSFRNIENSKIEIMTLPTSLFENKYKNIQLSAINYTSESMYPTIKKSDVLILNKDFEEIKDNRFYLIKYYDKIKICRIFKRKNQKYLLRNDNIIYPDEEVNLEEDIKILAQVIHNINSLA